MRKRVVCIVCHEDRGQWFHLQHVESDLSLHTYFYMNKKPSGYELAALKHMYDLGYEDIIIIQDSCIIKDSSILQKAFDTEGSVSFTNGYQNYHGKYQAETIKKVGGVPKISTKKEAVHHEGAGFNQEYIKAAGNVTVLCPELQDSDKREEIFGEIRMVIENQYFKKYKGCWHPGMIKEE